MLFVVIKVKNTKEIKAEHLGLTMYFSKLCCSSSILAWAFFQALKTENVYVQYFSHYAQS